MNYSSYLSLEQDFALRVLSDRIKKTTDVFKLQSDLIELFKRTLIIQEEMKNRMCGKAITQQELYLKLESRLFSYISSIVVISNLEELQKLLIEANKMLIVQENYALILAKDKLVPPWVKFGY
ncbi:MAG: hypothetical protein QNJ53_18175 [Pleurocapsa sp. MO_192.B19]|nr:hypothetical protein [Pleurocapsa sp. MO_192.B19]